MTFREVYRTVYVETSPPRHRLLAAIRMIASLQGAQRDEWIAYRNRRQSCGGER